LRVFFSTLDPDVYADGHCSYTLWTQVTTSSEFAIDLQCARFRALRAHYHWPRARGHLMSDFVLSPKIDGSNWLKGTDRGFFYCFSIVDFFFLDENSDIDNRSPFSGIKIGFYLENHKD
jgi:hypothetical protein